MNNEVVNLHEGQGGGANDLIETYNISNKPALQQLGGKNVRGDWLLKVVDSECGYITYLH